MPVASKKYLSKASSDRLERILRAAGERLERDGMDALTIRDLARESGVSPVTLYNRFGSKDNIVSLVVINSFNRNIDANPNSVRRDETPFEHLLTLVGLLEHELRDKKAFSQALMVLHFKHDNDRELPNTVYEMLRNRMLTALREMQLVKQLVPWVSASVLATEVADRILGAAMKWTQNAIQDEQLLEHLRFTVISSLHAFVAPRLQKQIISELQKSAVLEGSPEAKN